MPDLRTNKSIAQRFDVEFNKRPESALRRWRRVIAWGCAVLALALVGLYEIVGDGSAYWAGELSVAHQSQFEEATHEGQDGCAVCHTRTAQPLWRLVTGSRLACSVADERCESCHKQNTRLGHSPVVVAHDVLSCAACHEEHRGKVNLKAVASVRCVACHGNLRTNNNEHTFATHIPGFAAHPEFAASRFREHESDKKPAALDEEPGQQHGVFARARLVGGKMADSTPLHFNHKAHLAHDGALLLDTASRPDDADKNIVATKDDKGNQLRWQKLECANCHQVDAAGKYMQPIKFDQHCGSCHPLSYSEALSGGTVGPLPHVELSAVYREARLRLRDFVLREAAAGKTAEATNEPPRLPSKSVRSASAEDPLDVRLSALWPDVREVIKGGCAHCHLFRSAPAGGESDVEVAPPKIPNRWLPHSKFDHGKHKRFTCVSCHDPHAHEKENPIELGEDPDLERQLESERTSDILMPSVVACQKCHVSNSRPAWDYKANADCVECHTYHHKTTTKAKAN